MDFNYMSELTIVIPTYNRENRLLNVLNGLLDEPEIGKVRIVILDNCSDYDVHASLHQAFGERLLNTEIISHPFNIGMAINIASPFLYCKTKWLWILGDDDEVMPGCLMNILADIVVYSSYGYIKYEFVNPNLKILPIREPMDINNIDQYLDYYLSGKHSTGNMVFLSNNLYNQEILKPYLSYALQLSYTYIGHIIPVIFALCDNAIQCRYLPFQLVKFHMADQSETWDHTTVLLGLSSINDMRFNISDVNRRKLSRVLSQLFTHDGMAINLLEVKSRSRRIYLYDRIYKSLFRYNSFWSRINYLMFYLNHCFNLNLFLLKRNAIQGIKRKIRNKFPAK
jgi:glycosyltransferase involved in cell wall biosynthesis